MNCKHEDDIYVATFWRKFNESFKLINQTEQKFSPCGWVTDMASANFNGLATVYGEDILQKIKGCGFHFKQSIERRVKKLGDLGEEFKKLANFLLYSTSPEAYNSALETLKQFSINNRANLDDWIY